jgi:hypothetical protein
MLPLNKNAASIKWAFPSHQLKALCVSFVVLGLAYQEGKHIVVFRFIIEYSILRDCGP